MFNVSPQSFIVDFLHEPNFALFDWQSAFIEDLQIPQFVVHGVIKDRQIGFTSVSIDYALWKAFTKAYHQCLFIVADISTRDVIINAVNDRMMKFQSCTNSKFISWSTRDGFTFKNGSGIKVIKWQSSISRSERADLLIFDEAAMINDLKDAWLCLFPTISRAGQVILASTLRGKDEFCERIESLRSSNAFIVHTITSCVAFSQQ